MIGNLVGHYRILEKIGQGGMGEVYRARDERLGRLVALKLIRPASSENSDHLRRFEQEARAAAALNHPNILAIYDVGFEGKLPYIVSELLEGKNLRDRMNEGRIPVNEAGNYALQTAQGLTAAHGALIVHRDLKPENLFITNDDRVKILDFGVAKLQPSPEENRSIENLSTVTRSGALIGTHAYMSPEQARGKPVDLRSDIFSFGSILYEMLTRQRAFTGETEADTMTAVLTQEPPKEVLYQASIPAGYRDIVKHCMEKEPQNRFQSSKDLVAALRTVLASSSARIAPPNPKLAPSSRLAWYVAAALAAISIFLVFKIFFPAAPSLPSYSHLTFEAGTVYGARFAHDGHSVIYSAAWGGKPSRLFSTVGDDHLSQPLQFADANLLAVSRSGELALATHGIHSGQLETVNGMLATAPVAGGSPRDVLADVRWADWDAKGNLAVVHYVDNKSRIEYPINTVLYQSSGWVSDIRFSPDSKKIAFMDHPDTWDQRGDVRVVDLSGAVRTLSSDWGSESGLAWRPDGKEIWFSAVKKGNELKLMAVDLSRKERPVLDLPGSISVEDIDADGRVLMTMNAKRLAMGFTTLGSKEDVDLSWHDWDSARDISSDGQSVVFDDASDAADPNYAVVVRNINGDLPITLGKGSAGGLSPDGRWAIAIVPSNPPQITLLPLGAGQLVKVQVNKLAHVQNGWARFTPDGKNIEVNGEAAGHARRCYLIRVADGDASPTTPEGTDCGPMSLDGRFIVVKKLNQPMTIYSLGGEEPRSIPDAKPNFTPVQWSNDGLSIYGYHWGEFPSKILKFEIATGRETVVQNLRPGVPAGVVLVAPVVVSRDGKHFAYSYNQTLSTLYLVSGLH